MVVVLRSSLSRSRSPPLRFARARVVTADTKLVFPAGGTDALLLTSGVKWTAAVTTRGNRAGILQWWNRKMIGWHTTFLDFGDDRELTTGGRTATMTTDLN